jgi:D-amino-acid dehydrogenase
MRGKIVASPNATAMSKRSSTLIIGAGIVGLCTAYYLAKRGHKVTILERDSMADEATTPMPASKGNAGIIALGHPPLPRPGLVWKTIKWMLDGGSPLYVPPRLDFGLIAWMWNFRKSCTAEHFRRCMKILADFGWATGRCWDQLVDQEKLDCEYRRSGWLDVFLTKEGMEHGMLEANLLREHNFDVQIMSGDELRKRECGFKKEIVGAAHYTDSRAVSPIKFISQLATRVQEMGVEIYAQYEVTDIRTWMKNKTIEVSGDKRPVANGDHNAANQTRHPSGTRRSFRADSLVLAAGIWSSDLANQLGVKVPMQAGKGYHVMITTPQHCPSISCVLNETYVAVTPMNGTLRLAGTVELSGTNHRLMQKRVNMLAAGARKYIEGIDQCQIISKWCGLRPCTADGLPVIGWAPRANDVFIATGHAKYGLAYAPITGRIASECILDDKPSLDISSMRADRF